MSQLHRLLRWDGSPVFYRNLWQAVHPEPGPTGTTLETATGHLSEEALVLRATGTHPAPYPQGYGAHTLTFDLPEKGPEIRM